MVKIDKQVNFRLPDKLKTQIKELADKHRRTMTAQIVVLLENAVETEKAGSPPTA